MGSVLDLLDDHAGVGPAKPERVVERRADPALLGLVRDQIDAFGAVVGATIGSTQENLDVNGPLLVPGFGAQGGTVDDVRTLFAGVLDRVVVSTSREVLSTGPDVAALRESALRLNEELVGSLEISGPRSSA
jgi:orotidine-5'-phosphate decarboxylase